MQIPVHQLVPLMGQTITRKTYGAGTINSLGEYDPDLTSSFSTSASFGTSLTFGTSEAVTTFTAVVHPAGPRELRRLPEADRTGEIIAVYSKIALQTARSGGQPDVLTYQSRDYQVISVEDHNANGGIYICMARRIET